MPATTRKTPNWKKWVIWLAGWVSWLIAFWYLGATLRLNTPARALLGLVLSFVAIWVVARLLRVKLKLWGWEEQLTPSAGAAASWVRGSSAWRLGRESVPRASSKCRHVVSGPSVGQG